MSSDVSEEIHYRLLKRIEAQPDITQRQLAQELGVSVGKVNYCLKALVGKGWIKISNFRNSDKKLAYAYILTPRGAAEKACITVRFLRRKMNEYEAIRTEIEELRREVNDLPPQ